MKATSRRSYVCGTALSWDIGNTHVTIYPSAAAVKYERPCAAECGIAEVRVSLVRWIKRPTPLKFTASSRLKGRRK